MWKLCVASLVIFFLDSTYGHVDIRRPPTITKHPVAIVYRSEDTVTLECKAEGIPAPSYEWKKNTQDLNQNQPNIHRESSDGTLTIRPATSTDQGFYQCFAKNQYGTALSNAAHIQQAVLASTSGTSTVFQKTVEEGKPFQLQADSIKSFPKPSYGWETATDGVDKNPVPFRLSRRIQIAENGDLHFAYAQLGDALDGKIYKCTTYNPHLDVKSGGSYTKLTVSRNSGGSSQFAPIFGFASEEQTVALIGGSVTLRCFFYGNPESTIAWTGPRNTLPFGRYILDKFNSELVINNIVATDEGDYTCTGSNIEGRNTSTLQIRVEAVPRFITVQDGPRDVNVIEGESLTFNCSADAKPEATVVWFQDGQPLDPDKLPKRFVLSNDKKSLTIKDVCRDCDDRGDTHTDLTVIQCNASNTHGYAFAQGYLNVLSRTIVTILNKTDVEVYKDEEGRVQLECKATSDPSTTPTIKWYRVDDKSEELLYNNSFVTVDAGHLTIHVAPNAKEKWSKYLGQYRCVVETAHSRVSQTQYIYPKTRPEIVTAAALAPSMCGVFLDLEVCWIWVSIAAAVLGLFIIIVIICCAVCQRNKEEKYNVDKNERTWTGRDPVKEFLDDGFQEYQRVECITPTLLSSRPSFSSTTLLGIKEADREEDSLNEYMGDEGRFTEEGSFIGGTYRSQSRLGLE